MAEPQRTADTIRNAADKAQSAISDTAERTADTARDTWDRSSRAASQGLDLGTRAVGAYVEAGKRASARLSEASRALTETYSRQLAEYGELSRKAASVRSPEDFVQLQRDALQKMKDGFSNLTQVYGLFIDAATDSLQPIAETAASAKDRYQAAA